MKLYLTHKLIAPRMARHKYMKTMGDLWFSFFGKNGKMFNGVVSALSCCFCVAMQITAFGYMAKSFFGINANIGAIFSIIMVTAYCYYGGIKAVVMTDVIQILVIILIFPAMCYFAVVNSGGLDLLINRVSTSPLVNITEHPKLLNYLLLFVIYSIPVYDPAQFHRLIIARTAYRIKSTMIGVGIVSLAFYVIVAIMSSIAVVNNTGVPGDEALLYTIGNFVPKGIAVAGYIAIIAAVMSSIDSYLNSGSVIVVHDVIEPYFGKYIYDDDKIKAARNATIIIAVISCYLSLSASSIMDLVFNVMGIWQPLVVVPTLACLFNVKTSFEVVKKASVNTLAVYIIWQVFDLKTSTEIMAAFPCLIVNLVSFITFRHIEMNAPVASKDNELVAGVKAIRQKAIKMRSASMGQENSMDINYHLTQIEQKAEAVMA
ncbi:MAG: hypothetical protein AAF153_03045, partial [Pseudomonadota bacterium]